MRTHLFLIASLLLTSIHAADKPDSTIDSRAAFARLKTLVGEWQADTSRGAARLTYELIAGGTSLVERETGENMPAMLTVYHMDGNRLEKRCLNTCCCYMTIPRGGINSAPKRCRRRLKSTWPGRRNPSRWIANALPVTQAA